MMVSISQFRNIANYTAKYAEALGKSSILQTKAVQNVNLTGLKFAPEITGLTQDTVSFSKKLVSADSSLFSWAKKQPEYSFHQMKPNSVALVHMTNFFPKNGEILSTNLATKAIDGVGASRTTIHFCLNKPVVEHIYGKGWSTMDYAIILPFKEVMKNTPKSKMLCGINEDFMFQDLVKLPKGSVIVKYNPNVPSGNFLTSDAFEGIKLVESSNRKLSQSADTVIKKMGFTTYDDALKKHLGATNEEIKNLTSVTERQLLDIVNGMKNLEEVQKYKKTYEEFYNKNKELFGNSPEYSEFIKDAQFNMKQYQIIERYFNKLKHIDDGCKNFCTKENIFFGRHMYSPWMKSELAFNYISASEVLNNNSWGKTLKERTINLLKTAKDTLPEGKGLGYDVDKVIAIIEKSENPKVAKENLAKELKIKTLGITDYKKVKGELMYTSEEDIISSIEAFL